MEYLEINKAFVIGEQGLVDQLESSGIKCIGGPQITKINIEPEEYENYELDPEVGAVIVGHDSDIHYRKFSLA